MELTTKYEVIGIFAVQGRNQEVNRKEAVLQRQTYYLEKLSYKILSCLQKKLYEYYKDFRLHNPHNS